MKEVLELLAITLPLITSLTKTNDKREQRRMVRAIKKNRRKIYRAFKKSEGKIDEKEREALKQLDHAWVEATLKLNKF